MSQFNIPQTKKALPTRGVTSSPQIWKRQKAERDIQLWDNTEGLWIIQNNIYDLTNFVNLHPGGKHWIYNTKGHDISQHFKIHHLNQQKARSVLGKYYVKKAKKERQLRYTFSQKGLYQNIKRRLLKQYNKQDLQNNQSSAKDGRILFFIFLIFFYLSAIYQSYLLGICCGLLIYSLVGVGHNFIHMRDNLNKYFYLLTGFSPKQWEVMHCLSHHIYTNTQLDYQLQLLEPFVYYYTNSPKNKILNWIALQIIQIISIPINIFIKIIIIPLTQRTLPDIFFLVPLFQIPLLYLLSQNFEFSIKLFLTIHATFGFVFTKLTFIFHRTGDQWTEGNIQIKDFAEHQLNTTYWSYSRSFHGILSYLLFAGFNYHAVHHLFPTIDNYYHPQVDRIMMEQAGKIGMKPFLLKSVCLSLIEAQKNILDRKLWKSKQQ